MDKLGAIGKEIWEWAERSINGKIKKNLKEEEILYIVRSKNEVFIMVENKTIQDMEMGYTTLSK